jgi:O2-independent ubiquinone biosynthesis protein UbiV
MKISLGPLQYYWPRQQTLEFYDAVAAMPVDIVYLGETVCSRRHQLRLDDWLDVGAQLAATGKEVVMSTLPLIESESDLKAIRRLIDDERFAVEANEMGAVRLLSTRRQQFIAGPTMNVFNANTLRLLTDLGAKRWVMPPEASHDILVGIQAGRPVGVETEVFVHGRVPLAYSARCFTARRFNLQKDNCEFKCIDFPDGMQLKTREGDVFLNLNGIQTQSARAYNLLLDLPDLFAAGADILRIGPQASGTAEIVGAFRGVVEGTQEPRAAWQALQALMPAGSCNGFWHGRPGLDMVERSA